jgi:electron transport complex protein RnfG
MIREIVKPTLTLAAIAFISSLLLSYVQKYTEPAIERQKREKLAEALRLVLPGFTVGEAHKVPIEGSEFTFWIGDRRSGQAVEKGYAFITDSPGYGGDVESMVGVDEKGKILGLSILDQSESPGLGARCVEVANRETLWDCLLKKIPFRDHCEEKRIPWFQIQFKWLDATRKIRVEKRGVWNPDMRPRLLEDNAISALTGATITTDAVVRSVERGTARLKKALAMRLPDREGGAR